MNKKTYKPVLLCILDGFGIGDEDDKNNAIARAKMLNYQRFLKQYPHSQLTTSGLDVGLPEGQMGNSEVGHMTIGAGRIIFQDLPRINNAIADGSLEKNPKLQKLISDLKASKKACHLMGLLSDGGVHSHINHIIFLANLLSKNGVKVFIHVFLDGRDVAQKSALIYLRQLIERSAQREVEMPLDDGLRPLLGERNYEAADLWILSKLHLTTNRATSEFEKFEYARAREAIEEFFWKDFCDNYLEICKVRSYGLAAEKLAGVEFSDAQKKEIEAKQQSAILTLQICLNTLLKLFAPFIPHICDEIYSTIFAEEFTKTGSINARGNWPKLDEKFFNQKFHDIGEAALEVLFEVRKFKSEQNISMKTTVTKIVINCEKDLAEILEDLKNVCNAKEIEFVKEGKLVEVIL